MARKLAAAPTEKWSAGLLDEQQESVALTKKAVLRKRSSLSRPRCRSIETSGGYGAGAHLFPSRTEKLSPAAAMILRETVGK